MVANESAPEVLRRAAKVLRESADGATLGPWQRAVDSEIAAGQYPHNSLGNWSGAYARCVSHCGTGDGDEADRDARYIVLMHPPVALALAGWLEHFAGMLTAGGGEEWLIRDDIEDAKAVARAILREQP